MARSKKVTFSLPPDVVAALEEFAAAHGGPGAKSGIVAAAVREKITREQYLAQVQQVWGELDPELLARARTDLTARPQAPGAGVA